MGKGSKEKKITNEKEASQMILDYINKQNRPYNAGDICANLHDVIGKTLVVRSLASLAEDGKLVEKLNGKQKIYTPVQSQYDKLDPEELADLEAQVKTVKGEIAQANERIAALEAEYKSLTSQLTDEDAQKQLADVKEQIAKSLTRLERLQSADNQVSPEQRAAIVKKRDEYVQGWRKRKRMCMDIVENILESYPKSRKDLYNDVGIETDEEVGVNLKDFA